jgi:hypothetical protein
MSFNLSRRSRIAAVAIVTAALASGFAASVLPAANAQEPPPTTTGVLSNFPVRASNGFSNLPEFSGSGDGVVGAACTGATPTGGANIPAQVITNLQTDLTHLRILHNNGTPLTGDVRINCVLEVEATAEGAATLQQLQALSVK